MAGRQGLERSISARPVGRRLYWTIGLLLALAVLAVLVVMTGDDDGEGDDTAAPTTTEVPATPDEPDEPDEPAGPVPDDRLATALLPPVGALGTEWIETARDDTVTEVALAEGDCPSGPVPAGYLVRSEQRRTQGQELVEALAVTAGVVAEGVDAPSLDDPVVVECLLDGLRAALDDEATIEVTPDAPIGAPPAGAVVSHVQFVATLPDGGSRFDFVLVRRDRLVSLGLLTGADDVEATATSAVAVALDGPLQAALPDLG